MAAYFDGRAYRLSEVLHEMFLSTARFSGVSCCCYFSAASADTILSVSGPNYGPGALGGSSFQILGSAWSTLASYADVTVSVNLSGSPSSPPGMAFLITGIG